MYVQNHLFFFFQAFSSLAESAYELTCADEDTEPATYALSEAFEAIISKVMATADRSVTG